MRTSRPSGLLLRDRYVKIGLVCKIVSCPCCSSEKTIFRTALLQVIILEHPDLSRQLFHHVTLRDASLTIWLVHKTFYKAKWSLNTY